MRKITTFLIGLAVLAIANVLVLDTTDMRIRPMALSFIEQIVMQIHDK